jgi:hypothetical protein
MWETFSLITVIIVAFLFIKNLGKTLPICELILLIAGLQWVVGPILSYKLPVSYARYAMYVDQKTYFLFIGPAYILFSAVLLIITSGRRISFAINTDAFKIIAKTSLIIGISADVLGPFLPSSLSFLYFILSQFKYVGAILYFFSSGKQNRTIFYAAIGYLLFKSLTSGMFHDLLIWGIFFFMFWNMKYQRSFGVKLGLLFTGVLFAITIQTSKAVYRESLSDGFSGNKLVLFYEIASNQIQNGIFTSEEDQSSMNVRLNQGWIISAVISNMDKTGDFAAGETISQAIYSSILPRFLAPDKVKAGGRDNFRKYTGLQISDGTSMGISIIGEAYANYGKNGGILFMGIWGLFISLIWRFLIRKSWNIPFFIYFIPLIFIQVVKAETELAVVLNHLVKSSLVLAVFFYYLKYKSLIPKISRV